MGTPIESAEERAHNDRLARHDDASHSSFRQENENDEADAGGASFHSSSRENENDEAAKSPFRRVAGSPKPTPKRYIVEGLVPERELTLLFAPSFHGKSYLTAKMAFDITGDTDFFGLATMHGPALYLDAETRDEAFDRRCDLIAAGMGITAPKPGTVAAPDRLFYHRVSEVLDKKAIERIMKKIAGMPIKPIVIFLDSFQFASNVNPVDPQQVTAFFKNLSRSARSHSRSARGRD